MGEDIFRVAVVCSSNINCSVEAHVLLSKKGFNVRSFGSGDKIILPGIAPDKPNIYDFGCSYDDIYKDLYKKDAKFYTQNGLLSLLDRNRKVKQNPEKFQLCKEQFSVIITCQEKVFDELLEYFVNCNCWGNKPVHLINIDIEDNAEDAIIGAALIHELVSLLNMTDGLEYVSKICDQYEIKCNRPIYHNLHFY